MRVTPSFDATLIVDSTPAERPDQPIARPNITPTRCAR